MKKSKEESQRKNHKGRITKECLIKSCRIACHNDDPLLPVTGPAVNQLSFSDAEHNTKRKRTRREVFLDDMDRAAPWAKLHDIIEPLYPMAADPTP